MNVILPPSKLKGTIQVPSSKSIGHRELICAALAEGESMVRNITVSQDIEATCRVLRQFGADIREENNNIPGQATYHISGGLKRQGQPFTVDCGESGSTLRFLIPLGIASGNQVTYTGQGRLAERPLRPYYDLFEQQGISYQPTNGALPLLVSGKLAAGQYELPGNVSSQFFTGLLFVLPLLENDSILRSTTKLESKSYIDMTLECLAQHGIRIDEKGAGCYVIPGNQKYRNGNYVTEGDYSQAAFWLVAGALGSEIDCQGLKEGSRQGDKVILSIIQNMIEQENSVIDAVDCPDLVPVVTVLAAFRKGTTHIINAGRVRLKECDRLHAMALELNKLGAAVQEEPEGLIINGVSQLRGGRVNAWNDHRIAMSLAIASLGCRENVIIEGAECVRKSYPCFWQDFAALGGILIQEDS